MKYLRRLYEWVLGWANTPYGTPALFVLAFAESSFFPVPPDVLLIALGLSKPSLAFYYASVCSIGSVVGGLAGYGIGWSVWQIVDDFFFKYVFSQETFQSVVNLYTKNTFWAVFAAGFTPIPYKVFTIAGGACGVPLLTFTVASILSRSARFFLVALVINKFGSRAKELIERYFEIFSIAFVVLLIGGFAVIRFIVRR